MYLFSSGEGGGEEKVASAQRRRPPLELRRIGAHNDDPVERVAGSSTDAPAAAAAAEGEGSKGKAAADFSRQRAAARENLFSFSWPAAVHRAPNVHGRRVDSEVPEADAYSVYSDYDVLLSEVDVNKNVNKYYICQVLEKTGGGFATYFKWGKVGEKKDGDQLKPFEDEAEAIWSFEAKFNEKTRGKKDKSPSGEAWHAYKTGNFTRRDGYYNPVDPVVIETEKAKANAPIAPEAVAKMSVAALKEELSARGIDATGNKAALVARLTEALEKLDHGARNLGATLFGEYDAILNQTVVENSSFPRNLQFSNNKFYILQVLYNAHTHTHTHTHTRTHTRTHTHTHACMHTSNT